MHSYSLAEVQYHATDSQAAVNWHEIVNLNAVTLVYVSGESVVTVLIMLILCIADHTHHFRTVSSQPFDQNMDKSGRNSLCILTSPVKSLLL